MSTDSFRRHARLRADAAIRRVFAHRGSFVRAPYPCSRLTGHPLAAIHAFVDHVFGLYPTPRFLASAFLDDNPTHQRWFIALAQGASLRTLDLPIALTRRMGHLFLATPDHLSIDHALRRAELLGLGASDELVEAVLATRLGRDLTDWRKRLTWLATADVDLDQVGPIIDFLDANDIDLRGQTFASVMRLVTEWHARLAQERRRVITWQPSRYQALTRITPPTRNHPRGLEWVIRELTTSHDLWREGRVMRHCVSRYTNRVVAGWCRIWSLRQRYLDDDHYDSVVTIEVAGSHIMQIKGPANSRPPPRAYDFVCEWASREGLRLAYSLQRIGG